MSNRTSPRSSSLKQCGFGSANMPTFKLHDRHDGHRNYNFDKTQELLDNLTESISNLQLKDNLCLKKKFTQEGLNSDHPLWRTTRLGSLRWFFADRPLPDPLTRKTFGTTLALRNHIGTEYCPCACCATLSGRTDFRFKTERWLLNAQ